MRGHGVAGQDTSAHGTPAHGAPGHGASAQGIPAHMNWAAVDPQPDGTGTPVGLTVVNGGGGDPAPLPVRGAETRANPSEAVPGIRPDDRRAVAENMAAPPTPRNGAVRGSMTRPQLPRRRAQEHIVPELRGGPAPRPESEFHVEHDPNLMAAFQRGIGLAEAQCRESDPMSPAPRMEPTPMEPAPAEGAHPAPDHLDGSLFGDTHTAHPMRERPEPAGVPEAAEASARHDGSTPAG